MTDQTTAPAGVVSSTELGRLYPERDHEAQGNYYMQHIDAMTREGLHSKSRIAGELAARDMEIDRLRLLASHLRHCRECGETDVKDCDQGRRLWDAVM